MFYIAEQYQVLVLKLMLALVVYQASLFIEKEGVYYGQCSEICGINHGFMPIVVNAQSFDSFLA